MHACFFLLFVTPLFALLLSLLWASAGIVAMVIALLLLLLWASAGIVAMVTF